MRVYPDKITFTHVRYACSTGCEFPFCATFALREISHTDEGVYVIQYGWAIVSPKDQFCRKTGRIKALGRYNSNNSHGIVTLTSDTGHFSKDYLVSVILDDLAYRGFLPNWLKW